MTEKKYIDYTKYNKDNEFSGEITAYDFETIRGYQTGYYTDKTIKSMLVTRDCLRNSNRRDK